MSGAAIIKYTLLTARRDSLYLGIVCLIVVASALSLFLGYTAITEDKQMSIAYLSSSCRIIISMGVVLFVCFHVKRMRDSKEIELFLTHPISRTNFIFFYWLGFIVITTTLVLPIACILMLIQGVSMVGLFYWCFSVIFESVIMAAFSILTALTLDSVVVSILISYGFYILSRMMGFFIAFGIGGGNSNMLFSGGQSYINVMKYILSTIASILPRFDMFGKSAWLIYGPNLREIFIYQIQSLIYIPFILFITIFDFNKKQF